MKEIEIILPTTTPPLSVLIAQVSQKLSENCNPEKGRLRLIRFQKKENRLHLKYEFLKDKNPSTDPTLTQKSKKS